MIIIDASAAVEIFMATTAGAKLARIVGRKGQTLHAPHLIGLEVLHVPHRPVRSGRLTPARAGQALNHFANRRVRRYGRLALAEALRGILLACDAALANASGIHARVETV